jgi:hypothetical protein
MTLGWQHAMTLGWQHAMTVGLVKRRGVSVW